MGKRLYAETNGGLDRMCWVKHDGCTPAHVHGVHLADHVTQDVPHDGVQPLTLEEFRRQQAANPQTSAASAS